METLNETDDTKKTCSATKKDGSPCRSFIVRDGKCAVHSGVSGLTSETAKAIRAKKTAADARRKALSSESLRDKIARKLEEQSDVIVARLHAIVATGTDADSLRAIESMLSRVYGKPTEHLVTEQASDVAEMSLQELEAERKRLIATMPEYGQVPRRALEGLTEGRSIEH